MWPKCCCSCLERGVLKTIWGGKAESLCDDEGEGAFSQWDLRKAVSSMGRGDGVGGIGVAVREQDGVDADGSSVSDSHSLVTVCRPDLLDGE